MATLVSPLDRAARLAGRAPQTLRAEGKDAHHSGRMPLAGPVTLPHGARHEPRARPAAPSRLIESDLGPLPGGPDEPVMLTRTFQAMAAQMQKREAHLQAALRRERAIATTLQTAFLPQSLPTCPGYSFAAGYHPALREAEVGGDFYDLFRLPEGRIGLLMGDVSGKGLHAATYATMARYTLRAYALQALSPAAALDHANQALCASIEDPGIFVTAVYAVLDPGSDTLAAAAAGHWPMLVARKQATEVVEGRSLALGIAAEVVYEEAVLPLEPGDSVLLYTDGLVEIGRDDPAEQLETVRQALHRRRGQAPPSLVQQLYRDALRRSAGSLRDDVALLALRRNPRLGRRGERGGRP